MKRTLGLIISITLGLAIFSSIDSSGQSIYTEQETLRRVLGNGLTVVLHETRRAPVSTISLVVKTGSSTEADFSGSGISHLLEHMLFKESEQGVSRGSLLDKLKALGGDLDGFTSHDYTGFTVTVNSEYTARVLEVLKDFVSSRTFDSLELEKEKQVVIDEIRKNIDDARRQALDLSWSLAYTEHPYKYPVLGFEDLIARIEKKDIETYYNTRYSPHNMVLAVAGDINKDKTLDEINATFGRLKRSFVAEHRSTSEPRQLTPRMSIEKKEVSLAHVVISYRAPSVTEESMYPIDIAAVALGAGERSILTARLRDEKKLVYDISCHNATLKDGGLFYIYFVSAYENIQPAIAAINEEIEKIKSAGLSEDDLIKAKKILQASHIMALETTEGRAWDIAINEALTNNYDYSNIYLNKVAAVTVEQVRQAASAVYAPSATNIVQIVPKNKAAVPKTSQAQAQVQAKRLTQEVLANGMKIIVAEDHSMPLCSLSVLFLGGVRAEDDTNNGISYILSKALLDGTKDRKEEQIKSQIESLGGGIESISGNNSFGFVIELLKDDWKTAVNIAADIIMNSQLDEAKLEKEKDLALAAVKLRDDDIVRAGLMLFKHNFYGSHPYRFDYLGTKGSIQNITKADVASHFKALCVPANTLITISGDVNTEEILAETKKSMESLKAAKPGLPSPPAPKKLIKKKELVSRMEKEQSLILIGFPAVKIADNERYVFEVVDAAMSGVAGRTFKNIRSRLGAAYSIGTAFMPGIEPGSYVFYALTSAEKMPEIKSALIKEIKALKDKGVLEEELEAAKRYLIASKVASLQANKAFNMNIAFDELYGLGYKDFQDYSEKINAVTTGQLKRVVNQYLDFNDSLTIIVYGKGKR